MREVTQDLHQKAKEAGDNAQEAWNQVASFGQIVERLKAARNDQQRHQAFVDDLGRDLKQRPEPDEWLHSELDQYEERMRVHEDRQYVQKERYADIRREMEDVTQKQNQKRQEAGKHEEKKAAHEQRINDRESEIKKSAREQNIRGYDTELDDMQISEYMDRIAKLSKEQNTKIDRLRRENGSEIQKVQDILDTLREKRSALQEGKKSAKEQLGLYDRKTTSSYSELDTIGTDVGEKAIFESNIEDLETKIRKAKSELGKGGRETDIRDANVQLRFLEDEGASLNRELIQGTKQAGDLATLDHLKKESKDRQRSLETMTGAHGGRLNDIVGKSWNASTLESDFQHVTDQRKRHVADAIRQRDGVSRELEQIEYKLKSSRADAKKREKEVDRCAQAVVEKTQGEPDDYPENLAVIQSDRDTRKYDLDGFAILKKWYDECIDVANRTGCCRLCLQDFKNEKSKTQFISKMQKSVSKGALEAIQAELEQLDADLQKAKDAGSSYDTWTRLSGTELPILRAEIKALENKRECLLRDLEEHDKTVNEREEAQRDAEALSKPVGQIVKYHSDLVSFQAQTRELAAKQQDAGLSRTLDDVQEQIESVAAKSRLLRSGIAKLQADEQRSRDQLSTLELEFGRVKGDLATANFELEKRTRILAQIEDLKKSSQDQRESIQRLDDQLQHLAPQFAETEIKRDDIKQRGEAKEQELQKQANSLSDSLRSLQRADREIKAYAEEGGPAKLAKCQREIQSFQTDLARLESEQRQVTVEINKVQEELRNHGETKRIINDNLKYRRNLRELEAVKAEIEQLSAQNAEGDQEHHRRQAEQWQRRHRLLETDETSKMATMKTKDDQLAQLIVDWNTDYKDAGIKYKESHIRVEVSMPYWIWGCHLLMRIRQRRRLWRTLLVMAEHWTSMCCGVSTSCMAYTNQWIGPL